MVCLLRPPGRRRSVAYISINLWTLTDAQRRVFEELGIDPGDRVYVEKLPPLSNQILAAAHALYVERGLAHPRVTRALAAEFRRSPKTIDDRLRKLRCIQAPADDHASHGVVEERTLNAG
jgi:hypothetical protein